MNPAIDSVKVSFYLHATEDEDKVLNALLQVLSINRGLLERRKLEGHFGNVIVYFSAFQKKHEALKIWKRVAEKLDSLDREELKRTLKQRLEDNIRLHVRIDKQAMVLGKVKLGEVDPVKLEFRFESKISDPDELMESLGI